VLLSPHQVCTYCYSLGEILGIISESLFYYFYTSCCSQVPTSHLAAQISLHPLQMFQATGGDNGQCPSRAAALSPMGHGCPFQEEPWGSLTRDHILNGSRGRDVLHCTPSVSAAARHAIGAPGAAGDDAEGHQPRTC
jgi:hypothetical protein